MAEGESYSDKLRRLAGIGVAAGGIGYGVYKSLQSSGTSFGRVAESIAGPSPTILSPRPHIPTEFHESLLQEAFDAMDEVMSPMGWKETVRKAFDRSLYSAGIVTDQKREEMLLQITDQFADVGKADWSNVRGTLAKYEHQLGGFQNFYGRLRDIFGGSISGRRNMSVSQLIRNVAGGVTDDLDLPEVAKGLGRSDFEEGGRFWKRAFPLQGRRLPSSSVPFTDEQLALKSALGQSIFGEKLGVGGKDVRIGIRGADRPRNFFTQAQNFEFNIPGMGNQRLPYMEYQIGGPGSREFLFVPTVPPALEKQGMNFVAADHRGKSFASVPHFALPKSGGSIEVASHNQAISKLLYGDADIGVEGLVSKLGSLYGDRKAQKDLMMNWNTTMRGLIQRIPSTQAGMTQAKLHQSKLFDIQRVWQEITGEAEPLTVDDIKSMYTRYQKAGIDVASISSAESMAKHGVFSMRNWARDLDVFGNQYPMERRYTSRFRPFSSSDKSRAAMKSNKIMGILERGAPITATDAYRKNIHEVPHAVAYLSLEDIPDLAKEEAAISPKLKPMMEMEDVRTIEVRTGSSMATLNTPIKGGTSLGQDYRTGREYYARSVGGRVTQQVVDAVEKGDLTQLTIRTTLHGQDRSKVYGIKAYLRRASASIAEEFINRLKIKGGMNRAAADPVHRYSDFVEMIAHADVMKSVPNEVQRQMGEAMWITTAHRLERAGASSRMRAGDRVYRSKGQQLGADRAENWDFVHSQKARQRFFEKVRSQGIKTAEALNLAEPDRHLGVGAEMLKEARRLGATPEDISLIGGAYYKTLSKTLGGDGEAKKFLQNVGFLKSGETGPFFDALKQSKGVLAMPSLHIGGYDFFTERWGRASTDYRQLLEWAAQDWDFGAKEGQTLLEDMIRSTIPKQNIAEIERAASSLAGAMDDLPSGIETITNAREAANRLGGDSFLFSYNNKKIYVPSGDTFLMGDFVMEQGAIGEQPLLSAYGKLIDKAGAFDSGKKGSAQAAKALEVAEEALLKEVHTQYGLSRSSAGRVIGGVSVTMHRWRSDDPRELLGRQYQNIEEFLNDSKHAYTVGVTQETAERAFRDAEAFATTEELRFIEKQKKRFLAGERIPSMGWRHPTHKPGSMTPNYIQLVKGESGEAAFFREMTLKVGEGENARFVDVSGAAEMGADFDSDHYQLKIFGNEKASVAAEKMMNDTRWRRSRVESVVIQSDLQAAIKAAAAANPANKNFIEGLNKLVGVKMDTGAVSNLVGEMRAATAFNRKGKDFWLMSHLYAELEQTPISSKHGLHIGEVKDLLDEFVRGDSGGRVNAAMEEVWDKLLRDEIISADQYQFDKQRTISMIREDILKSEKSGDLGKFRQFRRAIAKKASSTKDYALTSEALLNTLIDAQTGEGDLIGILSRQLRMGPESGVKRSRLATKAVKGLAGKIASGMKTNWKYPAIGLGTGLLIASAGGDRDMDMRDHSQMTTNLYQSGQEVANVPVPNPLMSRLFTIGSSPFIDGYQMSQQADYNSEQMQQMNEFAVASGTSVNISDSRGAITPQYIDKIQRERYH